MLKYTVFLFLLSGTSLAQIVSDIDIRGHVITKEYVIQREIQHLVNVELDSVLAEEDRDRIENVGIFSVVEWRTVPLEDGTVELQYHVTESMRILPIVAPSYEEDTGWSIVYGGILKNLRGRNESLVIGGLFGGINAYGIEFSDPWIFGDHVSVSFQIGKHVSDHVFLPFERQTSSFEMNVGRYFGYQRKISIGFEIEKKKFVGDSTTIKYEYFAPQASMVYDTRDIYNDPSQGVYFFHSVQYFRFLNKKSNSLFWNQSYSAFISPVKGKNKTTLGWNITVNSAHGDLFKEIFKFGLGGGYSVRGWQIENPTLYSEGTQNYRFGYFSAVSSIELRQTVIPRFAIQQKSPFGPIKSEFGLQGVLFADAGVIGNHWSELYEKIPMIGFGIGFRIPVAMVGTLRFDYGWSFYKGQAVESSFHFSAGHKF
ncbi:MAG: BamA/TamA family outer membrane protein [Fidelibacterota bacterium]